MWGDWQVAYFPLRKLSVVQKRYRGLFIVGACQTTTALPHSGSCSRLRPEISSLRCLQEPGLAPSNHHYMGFSHPHSLSRSLFSPHSLMRASCFSLSDKIAKITLWWMYLRPPACHPRAGMCQPEQNAKHSLTSMTNKQSARATMINLQEDSLPQRQSAALPLPFNLTAVIRHVAS